jgi:hypothetical protein
MGGIPPSTKIVEIPHTFPQSPQSSQNISQNIPQNSPQIVPLNMDNPQSQSIVRYDPTHSADPPPDRPPDPPPGSQPPHNFVFQARNTNIQEKHLKLQTGE